MDTLPLIFTLFPSDTVSTGTRIATTWGDLCQVICFDAPQPREVPKKALALWCPATFKGEHRSRPDVEAVYALGFDVDAAPVPTEPQLRAALTGQACLFHLSSSATPAAPRWRLLLQLSRPVTGAEYDALWAFAAKRLPFPVGAEAKNPDRGWYMPRVPDEGDFIGVALPGAPLDVDAALALVATTPTEPTATAPAPRELGAPTDRRQAFAVALGTAWPAKGRHEAPARPRGGPARRRLAGRRGARVPVHRRTHRRQRRPHEAPSDHCPYVGARAGGPDHRVDAPEVARRSRRRGRRAQRHRT